MKLKASVRDLNTLEKTELAIFELENDEVKVKWNPEANSDFRELIEYGGTVTGKGVFFPKDGKDFMEALPKAFSSSSTVVIEEI